MRVLRGVAVLSASFTLSHRQAEAEKVPTTSVTALNGETHVLPDLFAQKPAVIVVGFSRSAKVQARTWSEQLINTYPNGNVYGLIVLDGVPRPLRGLMLRAIRHEIAPAVQARFLITTGDEQKWRKLIGVTTTNDAYLLVVDGSACVRWRSHEQFSPEALEQARRVLTSAESVDLATACPVTS